MASDKKLGRGLASLLSSNAEEELLPAETVLEVHPKDLKPNPYQPRKAFAPDDLQDLISSVRVHGVLQPVIARRAESGYELVAGERRWRAATELGLPAIPVVVREVPDSDMLTLALVENMQREDLGPIEKGRAFESLIDRFRLTQAQAATRLGFDRSTIANFIRLLDLPEKVQAHVSRGTLSMGHARALLAISSPGRQIELCERIIRDGLSVRDVERLTAKKAVKSRRAKSARKDPYSRELEDKLRRRLGSKVTIEAKGSRGKVIIQYHGDDDFQRILEVIGVG